MIAPSLLSADFNCLGAEIERVLKWGADWIHIDVMDGHFVPNLTMGPPVVHSLRKQTQAFFDVHLMIEQPEKLIPEFAKAGANLITVHIETLETPERALRLIADQGVKVGLTLCPATPVESIFPYLKFVDLVLVMTVHPGFSGQKFQAEQITKIGVIVQQLKLLGSKALIEVDGGINAETAALCRAADVLVSGNYIFKNDGPQAIKTLKEISR